MLVPNIFVCVISALLFEPHLSSPASSDVWPAVYFEISLARYCPRNGVYLQTLFRHTRDVATCLGCISIPVCRLSDDVTSCCTLHTSRQSCQSRPIVACRVTERQSPPHAETRRVNEQQDSQKSRSKRSGQSGGAAALQGTMLGGRQYKRIVLQGSL